MTQAVYAVAVLPGKNVMLTSSFTGWSNYMRDFGDLVQDEEAMKRFGQTMVIWDLEKREPRKVSACGAMSMPILRCPLQ